MIQDLPLGRRHRHPEGDPRRLNQRRLDAAFHPAGTLLASNGWEGRLRLWDAVLGRPVLSLTARIRVARNSARTDGSSSAVEDRLIDLPGRSGPRIPDLRPCFQSADGLCERIDPARRPGAGRGHEPGRGALGPGPRHGARRSCRSDNAWHVMFEASGDLLTSGVDRRAAVADPARSEPERIPHRPAASAPVAGGDCGIAEDRSGRIVAMANRDHAFVATPERTIRVGPLDDCRYVAVSPDGQWLATGSHRDRGAQVWRIRDGDAGGRPAHRRMEQRSPSAPMGNG